MVVVQEKEKLGVKETRLQVTSKCQHNQLVAEAEAKSERANRFEYQSDGIQFATF